MILAPSQTLNIQALGSAEWIGGAPLLCVAAGILLAICAEIVPGLRPARGLAYVGSLLAALFFELRLVAEPRGVIFQGAFSADATAALWGALFTFAGLLAWLYGRRYYKEEKPHTAEHDILMLCSVLGMMLMAGAEDLLTFFVGLELLSVPLYALAGFRRIQNRSVEAGLRYFLLGAFAAGLFLYGAALIYIATGTISLAGLREVGLPSRLAVVGAALVASSLFFKVSVFPFHFWVPDVYQGSPTPVTTFMATGTKAAGFAFLLKIAFLLPPGAAGTLAAISLVTMAIGNLGALIQTDLKRLLAYSAVAHAGTLLLVVTSSLVGDPRADGPLQAALYYMAAYVFTAAGGGRRTLHATRCPARPGPAPTGAGRRPLDLHALPGGLPGHGRLLREVLRLRQHPARGHVGRLGGRRAALGHRAGLLPARHPDPVDEARAGGPSPAARLPPERILCDGGVRLPGIRPRPGAGLVPGTLLLSGADGADFRDASPPAISRGRTRPPNRGGRP
jgi:NADH-quinone oxidoreductase subunit N